MHNEVKKCANRGEIKRLRYIFVDCLDVDPTFEEYKEDYNYCKKISGFFEDYVELTSLLNNENAWNFDYWITLKGDLQKNFAEKRFEHMIKVANIVYAEKIEIIKEEREKIEERKYEENYKKQLEEEERIRREKSIEECKNKDKNEEEKRENEEKEERKRKYEENYKKQLEEEERERIRREKSRKESGKNSNIENIPKKGMGVVIAIVLVLIIIALIKKIM